MTPIHLYKDNAIHYGAKLLQVLKIMWYAPAGIVGMIPVIVFPNLSTAYRALCLLGILFVIDFITGIWASWVEFKKTIPVMPGSGKRYMVQSSLLQLTAMKFVVYGLTLLVAVGIEWAFIAPGKEFEPHAALNKMTLTTMWIAFLCVVELYSILFENIKRIGFDIVQFIKKFFSSGWDIYKSAKNEKTE